MPVFGFKDAGFEISTESLGTLTFHRVSPEYAARIEKADFQRDLPPDAFLSLLMVILGSKQDGSSILVEEAYALGAGEREAFVHAFLNEHGEYYREQVSEERKSEAGEKVVRTYLGDRVINPRHAGEEPSAYLTRIYRDFASGVVTPEVRSVELPAAPPPPPDDPNDIFADSLLKNAALSESLGKSLAQMKKLENRDEERSPDIAPESLAAALGSIAPPDIMTFAAAAPVETPPVPVPPPPPLEAFEPPPEDFTAPRSEVALRFDETQPAAALPERDPKQAVELMQSLYGSVMERLEEFAESAEKNARAAKRARRVATLVLFVAFLLSTLPVAYLSFRDGYWGREYNKALSDQAAQAASQKQQVDTLKGIVDQMRAQQTSPANRIRD